MVTRAGKNTTMPAITATPTRPRPKISVMIGVIATSGTERSSMATGMNACSTLRNRTNPIPTTRAAIMPPTNPSEASRSVVPSGSNTADRLAAASGAVTMYSQTACGVLPTRGLMAK